MPDVEYSNEQLAQIAKIRDRRNSPHNRINTLLNFVLNLEEADFDEDETTGETLVTLDQRVTVLEGGEG